MDIREFHPIDLRCMEVQEKQALGAMQATDEKLLAVSQYPSHTIWQDGRPIFCGGAVELWAGRFVVWAYVSIDAGAYFLGVHRAVKEFLDALPARRMETAVACDFPQGHRWVRMLGFRMEAERMEAYSPSGEDHALYARVKEH